MRYPLIAGFINNETVPLMLEAIDRGKKRPYSIASFKAMGDRHLF
jgi:hypothetical protein